MQIFVLVKKSLLCIILIGWLTACSLPVEPSVPAVESSAPSPEKTEIPLSVTPGFPTRTPPQVTTEDLSDFVMAYTSGQDLYLFRGGKGERLTSSGDVFEPRISPDGEIIAFFRPVDDIHLEIWCIGRDGTNERKLVSYQDMDTISGGLRDPSAVAVNPAMDYQWVPGTHLLAFTSQQVYQGPGTNLLNDLILVDAEDGVISPLFLAGWGGPFAFSLDGKRIAISQPDKIILANVDGTGYQVVLTYDPITTYSEYKYYAAPIWSPNGDYLVVAIPPADPLADPTQQTEVWRLSSNGSSSDLLDSVMAVPFIESEIRFSPDTKWFSYLSGEIDSNSRENHLVSLETGQDIVVAKASSVILQGWAPDSQHFMYTLGSEMGTWLADISGKSAAISTEDFGNRLLAWVDDIGFVFWTQAPDAFELWYGTVNGAFYKLDQIHGNPPRISVLH